LIERYGSYAGLKKSAHHIVHPAVDHVQIPDSEDATERLRRSFGDMEWQNISEYNADEKGGTRFAFCKEGAIGFFRG